jgi:SAM-dependent methyltransferase
MNRRHVVKTDRWDSGCCSTSMKLVYQTENIDIGKCPNCHSYWAWHKKVQRETDLWQNPSVTSEFLETLHFRRRVQANELLKLFLPAFRRGRVLDYGCAQGTFVSILVERDIDAYGCDISALAAGESQKTIGDRFFEVRESWGLTDKFDFDTVTMLDVLEHCDDPKKLIVAMREQGVKTFIVKVPLANGPAFTLGRWLAMAHSYNLLESMFLVGDNAPHISYFNRKSLIKLFDECGFVCRKTVNLAEIGSELPRRIRGTHPLNNVPGRFLLRVVGFFAESLSSVWSETAVFEFQRRH